MKKPAFLILATASVFALAPVAPAQAQTDSAVATTVDPAKAAAADRVALAIVPDGTMERLSDVMADMMNGQIKDSMFAGFDSMTVGDAIAPYGVEYDDAKLARLKRVPMRELMLALDPYFEQRMSLMFVAITERMKPLYIQMEPGMRRGLAQSLAKDYSTEELGQLGSFVKTPVGQRFAANILMMFVKPEVMGEMQKMTPLLMKQMPEIMASVKDSMEQYPDAKADPEGTKKRLDALLEKYRDQ